MARAKASMDKVAWSGRVIAVLPRIRLMRSFDERHHSYQGYVLRINGICGDENGELQIAVGKVCPTLKRTESTRTSPRTGARMIEIVRSCYDKL